MRALRLGPEFPPFGANAAMGSLQEAAQVRATAQNCSPVYVVSIR